jgi:hypothetical protein
VLPPLLPSEPVSMRWHGYGTCNPSSTTANRSIASRTS